MSERMPQESLVEGVLKVSSQCGGGSCVGIGRRGETGIIGKIAEGVVVDVQEIPIAGLRLFLDAVRHGDCDWPDQSQV